ncbi:hypothetical protein Tco_0561341 [Tanacetum coccineum]
MLPPDNDNDTNDGKSTRENETNDTSKGPQTTSTCDIHSASISITISLDTLPLDPTDRPRFFYYDPNQKEEIRRLYWDRGACQPKGHIFPTRSIAGKIRHFVVTRFKEFCWLEYSIKILASKWLKIEKSTHFGAYTKNSRKFTDSDNQYAVSLETNTTYPKT